MKELDTVVVNKDIPDHGIERGDIGVVVHTYEDKSAVEAPVCVRRGNYTWGNNPSIWRCAADEKG